MTKSQELAAKINEATVALLMPDLHGKPVRFWIGQAQEAYSHAEQLTMSPKAMAQVQYAYDAFKVQVQGR